jgi:hypothetical protein
MNADKRAQSARLPVQQTSSALLGVDRGGESLHRPAEPKHELEVVLDVVRALGF